VQGPGSINSPTKKKKKEEDCSLKLAQEKTLHKKGLV
jgi:hypothetical protein